MRRQKGEKAMVTRHLRMTGVVQVKALVCQTMCHPNRTIRQHCPKKTGAARGWWTGWVMVMVSSGQSVAVEAHQNRAAAGIPARPLAGTMPALSQRQLTNRP
jgi:hypothetical protein